jgi:biotin synthase
MVQFTFDESLQRLSTEDPSDSAAIIRLLSAADPTENEALRAAAYEIKRRHVGPVVHFRGLIEASNACTKNCLYCGIRRDRAIPRYVMTKEEILACARQAHERRYGSIVLQAGERSDAAFVDFIEDIVREIKVCSGARLGVTLSLGEQAEETYRRWFAAGAHRYLLRVETSSPALYRRLHPADHDFAERVECLRRLRRAGYQVGTGVMIGLPFQTIEDLASDILFFQEMDIDMIGMGPYVLHEATPLAEHALDTEEEKRRRFELALRMISVARIALRDINIAAATALQALDPQGRERALLAGANILMPNLTPQPYRGEYMLYEGKPCVDEDADQCLQCLEGRIASIGESIGWDAWGDARHFARRRP